jgi:hypothetical protein
MTNIELDDWFFNLPAYEQMEITGIHFNEDTATDATYEKYDGLFADWWDDHDYEEKLSLYKKENE